MNIILFLEAICSHHLMLSLMVFYCASLPTQAATVDITNNKDQHYYSIHYLTVNSNTFPIRTEQRSPVLITQAYNENIIPPRQQTLSTSNKAPPPPNLQQLGIQYIKENSDDEIIQTSLFVYSQAKQIYNETETTLNNLTADILITLQLERYMETPQLLSQFNQPSSRHHQQNNNFQRPLESTSTLVPTDFNEGDEILSLLDFIKNLFQISTAFYLFGIMGIISLAKWINNFLLYKKSHSR